MSCPVSHDGAMEAPHPVSTEKRTEQPAENRLETIPQPAPKYFTRNLSDVEPSFLARSFWRLADIYGPIFKLDLGSRSIVIVSSQELVNEVCDQDRFDKLVAFGLVELRSFLGNGLFTAETSDPGWWTAHRLLVPAFGPIAMRKMFSQMLDVASQMILKWDRMGPDHEIELAFDTIGICGFGHRFNSFYSEKPVAFAQQMGEALIEGGKRSLRPSVENHMRVWSSQKYWENIDAMNKLCDDLIADRKANPRPDSNDILNVMLNQRDPESHEKMTEENIRFNMVTFLVAGHETTSGTLSFMFYHLLDNPEVLQKAQQEVDEVVGNEPLEVKHLPKLKYIEACIRETLRFMGPINIFTQGGRQDEIIGGKYKVEKGTGIMVNLHGLHHDPKVWGEDHDKFRPERLLGGNWEKLPPNAWKAFGTGLRACIGRALAEQEMLMNTALILQRFNVTKAEPSYKLELKSTLTIKPDGWRIKVRRRKGKDLMVGLQGSPSAKKTAESHPEPAKQPAARSSGDKQPLTIAWGSNAGTCKAFAEDLQSSAADFGFTAQTRTLDELSEQMPLDQPVIILTPSYEGQPPDNSKQFVSWLEHNKVKKELEGVQYCVFGAGNSEWTHTFHRIPKLVDELMEKMGAKRLMPMSAVDVREDAVGPFEDWKEKMWKMLREEGGVKMDVVEKELSVKVDKSPTPLKLTGGEVTTGTVLRNELLAGTEVGPAKRHMEVLLPAGSNYRAGDYIVVLPYNPVATVRRICDRFGLWGDDLISVGGTNKTYLLSEHPESAFDFFMSRVELSTPASKRQVASLAAASSGTSKTELERLASDGIFEKEVLEKRVSVLDLLDDHPACTLPLAAFIDALKPLTPRQYSISSSPLAFAGAPDAGTTHKATTASLTYDVIEAPAFSGQGRRFHGAATTYLANAEPGNHIRCWVRATNSNFRLPGDPLTPIIMIAAGTGIAPMMGFLQARAALAEAGARQLGPALLYFGCRDFERDYIYKDRLAQWQADGVVDVRPAFSRRGPPDAKENFKYAPDRIWAEREEVAELFLNGAKIFVCGSASKLAKSTQEVCQRIWLEKHPVKSESEAVEWLQKQKEDRYVSDVFG